MGRPRQQQNPAPTPPPEDPLADLRQDDDTPPAPPEEETPPVQENGEDQPEDGEVRPMVTQEVWDEMVTEAVVAFHQDPTSQGFLHGGGQCGCRYIARVALQAAVPVVTEEDLEEKELEPASD